MRYDLPALKKLYLLLCFQFLSTPLLNAQTLTLYSFPPPHPYRWQNPHSLLVSTIRNYYSKTNYQPRRILGHMIVELKKDSAIRLVGMVSDEMGDLKKYIVKDKIGLGVLFKLVNGHLEETSQVQKELKLRTETSRAAFITFNISDLAYNYLIAYIDSFKIKGYDRLYNGANLPRAGKGCGCTAFGISFIELINALNPEYRNKWAVDVKVPEKLIADSTKQKKISLKRIFFTFKWAKNKQPYQQLTLYEPYLIYKWVNSIWENEQNNPATPYQFIKKGEARGILINCKTCFPIAPMFTR